MKSTSARIGIALLAVALVTGAAVAQDDQGEPAIGSPRGAERVADIVPLAP